MYSCILCACLSTVQLPPPVGIDQLPTPRPLPVAERPPIRALTIGEFAATFKPAPGNYEVFLIHPNTGCPVCVKFCLGPGCPKAVRTTKRMVTFDYGNHFVRIRFKIIGGDLVVTNG